MKKAYILLPLVLLLAASCNSSTKQTTPPTQPEAQVGASSVIDSEIPARDNIMTYRDLKITYPAGGETWTRGSSYTVTWKTTNLVSTAKIRITLSSVTQMTTNSGKYTLQIPADLKPSMYFLKVNEIKADGTEGVGDSSNDYIMVK